MSVEKSFQNLFIVLSFLTIFLFVKVEAGLAMKITSPEFKQSQFIPVEFTCQGQGVNPSLVIEDIPKNTQSLALIVDDPDASGGTFVHWIVYDIAVIGRIEQNSIPGKQGSNDGGGIKYVSPCPPSGIHRYFFRIYALDKVLNLNERISRSLLESAMSGHILGQAELMGLYKKR